ncbi:hypothetical protein KUTeg_012825 [Tegillarca granosa]|uniref:Uncharacterized protein n=1 Tax=Tegillarca granosa TaxID=220873 RepID=A0ABQ9EWU6_TEGGR|nr:hypothetical protein KUTeg_012825 [Tegillarca granosa]
MRVFFGFFFNESYFIIIMMPLLGSHKKGEPKQVMFSDGIRPGGDLTELDGSDQVNRIMPRRTTRLHKKVERTPTPAEVTHQPIVRRIKTGESRKSKCLIPEGGLPPLVVSSENEGGMLIEVRVKIF